MINRLKLIWYALRLTNDGIAEMLDTAKDVDEFYRVRANFRPTPLPPIETFTVKLGQFYVRPEFSIPDDYDEYEDN